MFERYAIGGAVGATFYLEPLDTFDVDIFVTFRPEPGGLLVSAGPIFDDLARRGFAMEGEYAVVGGWPVQFLPPTGPLVEEALLEAATRDLGDMVARVFTAEHLAAIALQTGRAKDKARLLQFIEGKALDGARLPPQARGAADHGKAADARRDPRTGGGLATIDDSPRDHDGEGGGNAQCRVRTCDFLRVKQALYH